MPFPQPTSPKRAFSNLVPCSGAVERRGQADQGSTACSSPDHGKVRVVRAGTRMRTNARMCIYCRYTASCRLILCCESPSRVLDPVRSRCLCIRIPAPSTVEVRLFYCFFDVPIRINARAPAHPRYLGHGCAGLRVQKGTCSLAQAGGRQDCRCLQGQPPPRHTHAGDQQT